MIFMPFFHQRSVQLDFCFFVKTVVLLSLLPCVSLDQMFTIGVCVVAMCLTGTGQCTMYLPSPHSIHLPSGFSCLPVNISLAWKLTAICLTAQPRLLQFSPDSNSCLWTQGVKPCHLDPIILFHLQDLVIARNLPEKRLKRGGRSKQHTIHVHITACDGRLSVPSSQHDADSHPSPCFLGHSSSDSMQLLSPQRIAVLFSRNVWKHFRLHKPSMVPPPTVLPAEELDNAAAREVLILLTVT